ncbi:MAG: MobA/MobL family protein [Alphaproteobacteria bacterium]|nr:MobA/MobL family protein [Alphaproteobacteria bacterium]
MAIYHCSLKVFSRSEDACAIAKAAYRSGSNITNERTGYTHRYANKTGIRETFLLYPAPSESFFSVKDQHSQRAVLWNAAERSETRKNSRVARELVLALPHELSQEGQAQLTRDMAAWLIENYRVAVDCAIHDPVNGQGPNGSDHRNVHAHLMFTTRKITAAGMGKKTRILDDKTSGPAQTEVIREVWETLANDALKSEGFEDIQIDRRSYEDQGIDAIPQTHIGPVAGEAKKQEQSRSQTHDETDDEEGEGKSSSSSGGSGGQGPAAANKDERKANSDEDDSQDGSDEEGKQGSSSASSGDAVALKLESKVKREPHRTIDYPKIDRGTRQDFVNQIKALNAKREQLPDKPIKEQIIEVHQLIEKLDTRLDRLKQLEQGTSFPALIQNALTKALEFTARLVMQCFNQSEGLNADEQSRALKQERQQERYGKAYREGLHDRIERLTRELETLQKLERQYQAFDRFIGKLETEIKRVRIEHTRSVFKNGTYNRMQGVATQPSITDLNEKRAGHVPQQPRPMRTTSVTELRIKMQAKAAMIREQVPQHFRPELKVKSQEQYVAARSLLSQRNPIIYETTRTQNRPLENTYKKSVPDIIRAFEKAHIREPVREVKPIHEVPKNPAWQKQIETKIAARANEEPTRTEPVKIHRGKTMVQERRQAHREKVEAARSVVPEKYKPEVKATPETKESKGRVVFKDLDDVRQRRMKDVKGTSLKAKFSPAKPPREESPILDQEAYKNARYERSKDVRADVPPRYRAQAYEASEAQEKPSGIAGEFGSSDRPEVSRVKMSDGFNQASPHETQGLDDDLDIDLK